MCWISLVLIDELWVPMQFPAQFQPIELAGGYDSDDDVIDDEAYDADETATLLSKTTRGAGLRFRGRQPVSGLASKSSGKVRQSASLPQPPHCVLLWWCNTGDSQFSVDGWSLIVD